MIQVFRLLVEGDLGYGYISKLNTVGYTYYTHRLDYNKKEYQIILSFENRVFSSFSLKTFFASLFILSKKFQSMIPRWLLHSSAIYFFDTKGNKIKDIRILEELYKIAWIHEILYTMPIKGSNMESQQFKNIYDLTKKRFALIVYPHTQDELLNKIYNTSMLLDKSDLDISFALNIYHQNAYQCRTISYEISHHGSAKKARELKEKLISLKKQLNSIKVLLKKREAIWPSFESLLKQYAQRKKENERYKIALINDVISLFIPLPHNFLKVVLKDKSIELKNSFMGHKAIQKAIDSYKKEINLLDKYIEYLFNPEIPINKIYQSKIV